MAEDITYYARVSDNYPRERPSGIVRRRRLADGTKRDEAFTRNLRWEPTEYLDRYYILGSTGQEHVAITEGEADEFIRRLSENGPASQR